MAEKINYIEYWNRRVGFKYEDEFLIYRYLCRESIKSKELKRLPVDKRFNSYLLWSQHVRSGCESQKKEELEEFYHYLNVKKRRGKMARNFLNSFCVSIIAAFFSGGIIYSIVDHVTLTLDVNWLKNCIELFALNKYRMILGIGLFVISFLIICLVIIVTILIAECLLMKDPIRSTKEVYFIKDYIKIVKEIIKEKEEKESSLRLKSSQ